MTEQTRSVLSKFNTSLDISLLPSIFIALQEEDDVMNKVGFKSVFKIIRNLAAHEPSNLVQQLQKARKSGDTKLNIISETAKNGFYCIDVINITMCFLKMFKLTGDTVYLALAKNWFKTFLGYNESANSYVVSAIHEDHDCLKNFLLLQQASWNTKKRIKTVFEGDQWMCGLIKENNSLFWKIAVPNIADLIQDFFAEYESNRIPVYSVKGIVSFICEVYERQNN